MFITDGLNEPQREAVTAGAGPVLVLAGPGSGKTRVLTHRIAYLIQEQGVYPSGIMAVTFTNKAAAEMRARVEKLLGGRLSGLRIGTFHSICARLLRTEHAHIPYSQNFLVFDTDDQTSAIGQALSELQIDSKKFPPRQVLNRISSAKNELLQPEHYPTPDYPSEIVKRVYQRYQAILLDNDAMDFDDLLMVTAGVLRDSAEVRAKYQRLIEWVLVDEFQDTNTAQYQLVRSIAAPQNNIFAVGDEDQGIYAFRGADWRNVSQFQRDYPIAKVVLLEQNYRSTQTILDAARAVIDRNTNRTKKALFTDRGGGEQIELYEGYSDDFEARYVADKIDELLRDSRRPSSRVKRRDGGAYQYGDIAVMYRTNALSRSLEEVFVRQGIPYKLVGGVGFYKRREVRDLLAYLRVVGNPNDKVSFGRIVNTPKRSIGDKALAEFVALTVTHGWGYDVALDKLAKGEVSLSGRANRAFADFAALVGKWRAFLAAQGDYAALFDLIHSDIGYGMYLREYSDTEEQAAEREENVRALRGVLAQNVEEGRTLAEFLAENALMTDIEDQADDARDKVTLLTLHAAKGLEYPVVFIVGCEDGVLPHSRAIDEGIESMSEERRLFYVGITRAEERLYLSYAFRRALYGGQATVSTPSRFLADVPSGLMTGQTTRVYMNSSTQSYRDQTSWERPSQPPKPDGAYSSGIRNNIVPFPSGGRAAGSGGGGVHRSPPSGSPTSAFKSGQKVRHTKFGLGTVLEVKGRYPNEMVSVAFEDKSIRMFMAGDGVLTPQ
ncbi:MAG: UvrD-helicase domain-containing protein [Anaerolineae bacterium]|jgi:DNA helicase-2/ATP-dependent DNA helicase PcrA|nr:UvrD-helicase domain-containing protein [Anaerolineae bacterium]